MTRVEFGKVWEIKTVDDCVKALEVLHENEFIARMSDDFRREDEELTEISRQKAQIARQAKALGLI